MQEAERRVTMGATHLTLGLILFILGCVVFGIAGLLPMLANLGYASAGMTMISGISCMLIAKMDKRRGVIFVSILCFISTCLYISALALFLVPSNNRYINNNFENAWLCFMVLGLLFVAVEWLVTLLDIFRCTCCKSKRRKQDRTVVVTRNVQVSLTIAQTNQDQPTLFTNLCENNHYSQVIELV
ncbi:hypothetical protein Ciccas_004793 [Cichlidogyrus casuarinus]|uniref:Uncharacterized protein n=1 Tax=Cichlidogyrus casuarinus TaxID=1844966 RepID=A0ABD2QAG4_9PLAT